MSKNPPSLQSITELSSTYNATQTVKAMPKYRSKSWYEDFRLFFSMLNTPDFKLEKSTMLSVGGALAYVVLPIDLVPDFLPLLGWVDDALVLKIVMDSAKGEIDRFRKFQALCA